MKKFFLVAGMAAILGAGNNDASTASAERDSSDHAANASTSTYTASDGDVSYRNGRVVVWRDNDWVETEEDVKLEDGTVVRRNGQVEREGKVIELEDGEVVDRTGRFFDKAGNAIENAWDDVKEGVKKGADKVGEEVKDVFDDKDNN
jgi:hypothetical protein